MTCRLCEHWSRLGVQPERLGACHSGLLLHVLDENDRQRHIVSGWNKVPENGLGATDGSDFSVQILTGPDFGCIHFKAKE